MRILPFLVSLTEKEDLKDKYFALSDLNYDIKKKTFGKNDPQTCTTLR